jgi:hypothetical protein
MLANFSTSHAMHSDELVIVQNLLSAHGVSPEYAQTVLDQVELPKEAWPTCCGSTCDPCVTRLNRVAICLLARRRRASEDRAEDADTLGSQPQALRAGE